MADSTTMKVTVATKKRVYALAAYPGESADKILARLLDKVKD